MLADDVRRIYCAILQINSSNLITLFSTRPPQRRASITMRRTSPQAKIHRDRPPPQRGTKEEGNRMVEKNKTSMGERKPNKKPKESNCFILRQTYFNRVMP